MKQKSAIALLLLCGCQPVYTQEPGGIISFDPRLDKCSLQIDPADGSPTIEINAKCSSLADHGIRVVTDSCGTFEFHPLTKRGSEDGLASLDGYREVASHDNCPFRATSFPDAWTLQ